MTFRLLITGSRVASIAMWNTAEQAVLNAKANGWSIVVGDANGVDRAVVEACIRHSAPFECFGIANNSRISAAQHRYTKVNGNFYARDEHMVRLADRVFAIWNGYSGGTRHTFEYAQQLAKPTDIRTFKVLESNQCSTSLTS